MSDHGASPLRAARALDSLGDQPRDRCNFPGSSPWLLVAAIAAQAVFEFLRMSISPEKFIQSVLPPATMLVTDR